MMINQQTGTIKFEIDQLDPTVFFIIDKMKEGEISNPVIMKNKEGKQSYRILYLKSRTLPHRANLKEDYNRLQEAALNEKKNLAIKDWINKKSTKTYISIIEEYKNCNFKYLWMK